MKKAIASFLNKPLLVVLSSVIVAGAIGGIVYKNATISNNQQSIDTLASTSADTTVTVASSSSQNLSLGFLTSGRIKSVLVKVGDVVKKDTILASLDPENTTGAITQAKAAFDAATANYQKIVNGATGPTINAAKTAVTTATVNLDQVTKQQDILVKNAYINLLNTTPQAYPKDPISTDYVPPTITGSYTLGKEGDITIRMYGSGALSGQSFEMSGLVGGIAPVTYLTQQSLGNSGLYISFPTNSQTNQTWIISIPNKKASDYITKYNAYQTALQTRTQAIATAQSSLDQATSNLAVVVAAARPEDVMAAQAQVESARGTLQIAQAAYNNRIIRAPINGTVSAVHISAGQIAVPNAPAIELSGISQ